MSASPDKVSVYAGKCPKEITIVYKHCLLITSISNSEIHHPSPATPIRLFVYLILSSPSHLCSPSYL